MLQEEISASLEVHQGAFIKDSSFDVDWLMSGALQKMVLVITSTKSNEVLERWTFDLQTDKAVIAGG